MTPRIPGWWVMWPALALAPQDDQRPSPHWMQSIHSAWEEEERVDLGWVLEVFTESEMLRSGLVFLMGSLNHHWKTATFPSSLGAQEAQPACGLSAALSEPRRQLLQVSMRCSPFGVFWWFWFIAPLTSPWTIQHKWCVPVPWDTEHTGNSSFSVTWSFVSILNI